MCTSGSGQTEQVRERMRKQVADRGSFEREKLEQPHLARSQWSEGEVRAAASGSALTDTQTDRQTAGRSAAPRK